MSLPPYESPEDSESSLQLQVIRKYFAFISIFDFDNLSTLMTDEFTQQMAPSSLGVPKKTKSDFLAYLGQYQANIKSQCLDYTIYDINDGVGKTWVHAKLGIRNIEVIYMFQFGTGVNALKINSLTGFTDSNRYLELHPVKSESRIMLESGGSGGSGAPAEVQHRPVNRPRL